MSTTVTEGQRMAGRKKTKFDRGRVEFKAEEAWVRRATAIALRLGFGNLSAYIRFAVTDHMNRVSPETEEKPKRGGRS
jgi:hypothetical protein